MDGAGDKTQIVDSAMALSGGADSVLFDDSSTGKNPNPIDDSSTGRTDNPLDENETLDGAPALYTSDSTMAAPRPTGSIPAVRAGKGKNGAKPQQVVIGDGEAENYGGATMIGPAPTSRPGDSESDEANEEDSTEGRKAAKPRPAKGRNAKPVEDEESESDAKALEEEDEDEEKAPVPAKGKKGAPTEAARPSKPVTSGPKKPVNPKVFIIAGAAVLLLGIIGIVVAVATRSNKGGVMFAVEPASAKVVALRVDGQPATPNVVIELEPGPHRVVVGAAGFAPLEQTVNVVAGQKPLPVVLKLKPEGGAGSGDTQPPDKQPEPDKVANNGNGSTDTPPKNPDTVAKNRTPPQEPRQHHEDSGHDSAARGEAEDVRGCLRG